MKKLVTTLLLMVIAALGVLGSQWYFYVTNTTSPYDEIGIELNTRMPEPIRRWGCAQLQGNFPNSLPPYGCQSAADPIRWN